jgi:phenylacetate-CoA ligase
LGGRLLYRLSDRLGGRRVVPALDAMLERQSWDPSRLAADGRRRLADLVAHAARAIPFYRGLGLRGSEAIEDLPLLDRRTLRDAGDALRDPDAPLETLEVATSGGSTGAPAAVWLDRAACDAHTAAVLRSQTWMGLPLVARHALLWGPPPDVVTYGTFSGRIRGIAARRTFYPTYGLTDERAEAIRRALRRGRFPQVVGYSSALDHVAAGAAPLERPARAVLASAEILTPPQRRRIGRFFGAPVFERFGCNEFATVAHQCGAGGMHVLTDRVHLEILRPDGRPAAPGEIGEAVVSDLDNRAMPLLRYRLGDALEAGGRCSCPLPFPVFLAAHGRMTDLLEGTGGRPISPRHVAVALETGGETLEHQLRVAGGHLACAVRPLGRFDAARAAVSLQALLGRPVEIRMAAVIPRWPSGKVRPVVREEERA